MAVKEGFEPSIRDKPYTPLAGERLQPLGHLTVLRRHILRFTENMSNTFFEKIHETDLTVADLIKVTIKRTLPLYYDEKKRVFPEKKTFTFKQLPGVRFNNIDGFTATLNTMVSANLQKH